MFHIKPNFNLLLEQKKQEQDVAVIQQKYLYTYQKPAKDTVLTVFHFEEQGEVIYS